MTILPEHVTYFGAIQCKECEVWHVFRQDDDVFELLDGFTFEDREDALRTARMMTDSFRWFLDEKGYPYVRFKGDE